MKKFGFGKKADKNTTSAAAPISNPYAQPKVVADPYIQDGNNSGSSPNYATRQSNGLPNGPGAVRNGGTALPNTNTGYGADRYASGAGYGTNRYDTSGNGNDLGGYGGMGGRNSNEIRGTEENRDALFGGAKDRYAQKGPPLGAGRPGGGYSADSTGGGGRYGGGYGEDRQLTQEEEEEEEIAATKQEIRFMKQEDVSSTQRALAIAAQAEETGRATLGRLGAQSERLYNTEKNLDLVANSNRKAEEKAKELKTLNRSMFAVHVSNPFTSSSRRTARDEEIQAKHQQEREQREATRQAAFNSRSRFEGSMKEIENGDGGYRPQTKASLAERSRYQFEADSEDEEMENQIDRNLDALGQAAGRLNALARATGKEVEEQNKHIDRIMVKSDRVDDQINMNRARLDRIK